MNPTKPCATWSNPSPSYTQTCGMTYPRPTRDRSTSMKSDAPGGASTMSPECTAAKFCRLL